MMKKITSMIFLTLFFSCMNPKDEKVKNSPDLFGWTEQHVAELKNECLERYGKDNPGRKDKHREDYCNCFVEKIIYSMKHEQHVSPDDETVRLYEEFSKACEELTVSED